jgi:hypothetical protein
MVHALSDLSRQTPAAATGRQGILQSPDSSWRPTTDDYRDFDARLKVGERSANIHAFYELGEAVERSTSLYWARRARRLWAE